MDKDGGMVPQSDEVTEEVVAKGTELMVAIADAVIDSCNYTIATAPPEVAGMLSLERMIVDTFSNQGLLMNLISTTVARLIQRRGNGEDI